MAPINADNAPCCRACASEVSRRAPERAQALMCAGKVRVRVGQRVDEQDRASTKAGRRGRRGQSKGEYECVCQSNSYCNNTSGATNDFKGFVPESRDFDFDWLSYFGDFDWSSYFA